MSILIECCVKKLKQFKFSFFHVELYIYSNRRDLVLTYQNNIYKNTSKLIFLNIIFLDN